jgi:hypothetical protein
MDSDCAGYSSNAAVCGAYARYNRFISKVLWMKHLDKEDRMIFRMAINMLVLGSVAVALVWYFV